ncbi:hypothetical protein MOV76_06870 [Rhizobium sp. PRIMUS64]|uniref:hypothetical protein n=1 Tax=Rhizobium sp. PRIMUS64 TaxID=2908925 RepID=UPI001FF21B7F|nr:hypothetical protein [Rhizobium sp. PRIMUS64]MCJ9691354.1 hypothetical protein [Rhizobium sp. PRIMUS64]
MDFPDFVAAYDKARIQDIPGRRVRYRGSLLLPGCDVAICLKQRGIELRLDGTPLAEEHPVTKVLADRMGNIQKALSRKLRRNVLEAAILGRWHPDGDEDCAFEPYFVRFRNADGVVTTEPYRFKIFLLDGLNSASRCLVDFASDDPGPRVKAVLETVTESHIHFDELPKSVMGFMPCGIVWYPPRGSGYPALVENAIGKMERSRRRDCAAASPVH